MNATPYIENGKWKLFDKTYTEQSEADKILFDGFFNTIRKHLAFFNPMQERKEYTVFVFYRYGDHVDYAEIKVIASSEEEALNKASLPPRFKIYCKELK
ncbi:hypothetical protein H4K35_09915 [Myroides sp. NP-2]|uniref:hypothetical protein n=1 Tax=Myroides sp. NP-2 TaxID=2759945 RepID=UPI0015FDBC2A|nr:hypothetical protein [Myroides sp. NP-2]MBB1150430.1 hypothetical protein [Myroides sp. NP-2]